MPISIEDYKRVYRTLPVSLTYETESGETKSADLTIKYRPITQAWVDRYGEITNTNEAIKERTMQEGRALSQREHALNTVVNPDKKKAAKERAQFQADLDAYRERIKAQTESHKQEFAELLASTLIDVDMTDAEGKRVSPTAEFLVTLDFEFLREMQDGILKKTFRVSQN
jgi:hypothetical protein